MRKYGNLRVVVASVLVVAASAAYTGCEKHIKGGQGDNVRPLDAHKAHNLKFVKCKSGNDLGTDVPIEVENATDVFVHPDDRVIFICKDEFVRWVTANNKIKIKIDFKDKTTATELFVNEPVTFESDPSAATNQTDPKQVKESKRKELLAHAYTLEIDDLKGNMLQRIDPHIIPMGK